MGNIVTVAKTKDIPSGKAIAVSLGNKRIAIFNVNGKYFAIDDECTHAGGNLSEGELEETTVTCPWHGATFNVTDGCVLSAPAMDNVASYKVHVEGEDIKVEAP